MNNNKKKLCVITVLCLCIHSVFSQQATTAAGGSISGSGGSVAFAIGQIVYTAVDGTGGAALQGVEQPYEIFPNGVNDTSLNISLLVYPNPTVSNLTLQISNLSIEQLHYQLFDKMGQLILSNRIYSKQTEINTSSLPTATYYLNVTQDDKTIQSFQIIKLHI